MKDIITVNGWSLFSTLTSEKPRACPSPFGRRTPGGPDEGGHTETFPHSHPHPALRATLSRRERDLPLPGAQEVNSYSRIKPHFLPSRPGFSPNSGRRTEASKQRSEISTRDK